MSVIGWKIDPLERGHLLEQFPPRWPDAVADHVTLQADASPDGELPQPATGRIVGIADDGEGVEAMVVALNGNTDRPDGSTYHITWSLDRARGRRPVESNRVIVEHGWTALPQPVPVSLIPARLG